MPPKSKETKNAVFRMSCLSDWNYNETNDGKLEQIEAGIKKIKELIKHVDIKVEYFIF